MAKSKHIEVDEKLSKQEEAFKQIEEAVQKDNKYSPGYFTRGQFYHQIKKDFKRALFDFSMAIRVAKENQENSEVLAEYYNFAGVQYLEMNQLEEALKHFNLAIDYNLDSLKYYQSAPNHGTWLYNRGRCKSKMGQMKEAIEDFSESIKETSADKKEQIYDCRFQRGICYRTTGQLERAIEDFKKAIDAKSDRAAAYNNLGLSHFQANELEDALQNYQKAIQLEPNNAAHYNNRGLAYFQYEKLEEAETDFNFAHEKDPTDPTILFNRGNVYLNWDDPSQRFEEAHRDYASALELAPNHVKILHS